MDEGHRLIVMDPENHYIMANAYQPRKTSRIIEWKNNNKSFFLIYTNNFNLLLML